MNTAHTSSMARRASTGSRGARFAVRHPKERDARTKRGKVRTSMTTQTIKPITNSAK